MALTTTLFVTQRLLESNHHSCHCNYLCNTITQSLIKQNHHSCIVRYALNTPLAAVDYFLQHTDIGQDFVMDRRFEYYVSSEHAQGEWLVLLSNTPYDHRSPSRKVGSFFTDLVYCCMFTNVISQNFLSLCSLPAPGFLRRVHTNAKQISSRDRENVYHRYNLTLLT